MRGATVNSSIPDTIPGLLPHPRDLAGLPWPARGALGDVLCPAQEESQLNDREYPPPQCVCEKVLLGGLQKCNNPEVQENSLEEVSPQLKE